MGVQTLKDFRAPGSCCLKGMAAAGGAFFSCPSTASMRKQEMSQVWFGKGNGWDACVPSGAVPAQHLERKATNSLLGCRRTALAGESSLSLFLAGQRVSRSSGLEGIAVRRETCMRLPEQRHVGKQTGGTRAFPSESSTSVSRTARGIESLLGKCSGKEKQRRRIVDPMSCFRKPSVEHRGNHLSNCSRLGAYNRSGLSMVAGKDSLRPILSGAQIGRSSQDSRKARRWLRKCSQSARASQQYNSSNEACPLGQPTKGKGSQNLAKSRAWTAWKQTLSSQPVEVRLAENASAKVDKNTCSFTWHCVPPEISEKCGSSKIVCQEQQTRQGGAKGGPQETGASATKPEYPPATERESGSRLSQRDLALGAISRALSPKLQPSKNGQGELALRMAEFVAAIKDTAQTNEIKNCESKALGCLSAMVDAAKVAQVDLDMWQLWIDVTELQLKEAPSEADVVQLLRFLEELEEQLHAQDRSDFMAHVSGKIFPNSASSSFASNNHVLNGKESRLDDILKATSQLERTVSGIPKCEDIQKLTSRRTYSLENLLKREENAKAAVKQYRDALSRGEVAWFKNLQKVNSRLESVTGVVLPLEDKIRTPSAPT